MINLGQYYFYGTHINITDVKYEDGITYYFIKPDVNPEGWWSSSDRVEKLFSDFQLSYVGPCRLIEPAPYLKEFRFPVE